ncbi:Hypothetical_protein [Hexamita inflata]|uniref:Hypothetical_protein n=1 Tax=Hexamita inflata TaxID=28002 RepID=A0AA86U514_9EUKA|nr:Hypothetical protein HINF_LOCUS30600 [Hexamita inflata]
MPTFSMFTLASKQLLSVNFPEDSATNFVSALTAIREKMLFVTESLFGAKDLHTIYTANGSLDVFRVQQVIIQQFLSFKSPFSRNYAEFNYLLYVMQASEKFQRILAQNQSADLSDQFQASKSIRHDLELLFLNTTLYNASSEALLQQELTRNAVMAFQFSESGELYGLALQPGISVGTFASSKQDFARELNALRILSKESTKICIPSIQPTAFLTVKKTPFCTYLLAADQEIMPVQCKNSNMIVMSQQFQFTVGKEEVKQIFVFNLSRFQMKKMTELPFVWDQLVFEKYQNESFFNTNKPRKQCQINNMIILEENNLVLIAIVGKLVDQADFEKRAWQLMQGVIWADL